MDSGLKHDKKPNPRENANPISAATMSYTIPTFIQGYKRDLEVTDLHETLTEHKSSRLGNKLEALWNAEEKRALKSNSLPSLKRVLIKAFGLEFLVYGLVLVITEIFVRLYQPIFLGKLVHFFTPRSSPSSSFTSTEVTNGSEVARNSSNPITQPLALGKLVSFYIPGSEEQITETEAYCYAAGIVACSLVNVFVVHPYMLGVLHVGMKLRVACCSLIYRKSLKLSKSALGQTTAGQIVNLLSNDVNRFDVAVIFAHILWVGPLETIIVTYLLYREVGISAVIGVVSLLLFIPLQFFLGKKAAVLRLRTALRTDERVRLMNEIISGIQVIKMYTWEKPFAKLVSDARRYEIKSIRITSYIRGIMLSFIMFTTRVSSFLTILAYICFGNQIDAKKVFVITAFYNILRQSMTVFFPQGISQIAEANVSIKRLNKFLTYSETQLITELKNDQHLNGNSFKMGLSEKKYEIQSPYKEIDDKHALVFQNATAKWSESSTDNTFTKLDLKVEHGKLIAVIGPVGSGKSSLLQAILKELPLTGGTLVARGSISYASQEPWLFPGSVRQNILFGQALDKMRYRMVTKKCALERDFQLFPYGDKTIVGERGVSLSGGQRARINLARAVYKEADIYLLDDPLSAVDTHVGKQLFEQCIRGYLKSKTVILVTHQLQYLKDVDRIVILEDGLLKAEGNFQELQDSGLDFAKLLESNTENLDEEPPVARHLSVNRKSSIVSTGSIDDLTTNVPAEVQEQKGTGSVSTFVYKAYLRAGGSWSIIFLVFVLFVLSQLAASAGDYFVTYWVNMEQRRNDNGNYEIEHTNGNTGNSSFNHVNNTSANLHNGTRTSWQFSKETAIYTYLAVTIATIIVTLLRSVTFFSVCMKASVHLHDNMFNSICHATMRFFNTNTSGRILNRFSKDMGSIDELLPAAMIDCLQIGLSLIGIIIVVGIVNPWLMIPTVLIGIIFYFFRIFYIRTSRSVKRLEGVTRSPVFAHINASLQGLTTIRAFGAQSILEKEFDNHQDLHSSAWFTFIATSRAFGFWLDIVCVIYIAVVTLSFLVLGSEQYGGNVGLAITQAIGLTGMFQWGMRQSTELENQMTSVERVLDYSSVQHEPPLESPPQKKPPKTWPDRGEIRFVNLYLKYFPEDPPVLKNLNFTIKSLEKVGIVGRTGAGKSSLISALFQLTETEGSIIIDKLNIIGMGLHDLRSKISIIPQEPVLFSGTMRKNLDPFDEYDDETLWKALEEVELKDTVNDLTAGLNSKMSEGGANFSVGQRQLVCLARAIIRNNKILVLDEATANVDPQTDALIQHTIRKKFETCTVLTIAHRLHTVMDSDKVLVMDAGSMVEFDHPHVLLQNKDGQFYSMVQQTGRTMAEALARVAENSYRRQQVSKGETD